MSCSSCGKNGLPNGCKNNGLCGISGCNKLTSVDWLGHIQQPHTFEKFIGVEVRFKNGRKEFFQNNKDLSLYIGDVVVVDLEEGYDIGVVALTGDLVKVQMTKKGKTLSTKSLQGIQRKASSKDIEKWEKARVKEADTMFKSRVVSNSMGLTMKISDVEYQGDGKKATFYYTAENRVDFRDLVKKLAQTFKVKVEMKQIGMRQEAARIGGIGSCGRELCCSTWLTDFRSVSSSAARYQQLSLNPDKLAGQCGKLKCCLNYELDNYMEELKKFPSTSKKLVTKKGRAVFQKMDIFKNTMTYSYEDNLSHFIELPLDRVIEIMDFAKAGKEVEHLEAFSINTIKEKTTFKNVVGQDSLTRFDGAHKNKKKRKQKRKFDNKKK